MTAPGRNRLRDAYCVTFFGDWEEPSGESRLRYDNTKKRWHGSWATAPRQPICTSAFTIFAFPPCSDDRSRRNARITTLVPVSLVQTARRRFMAVPSRTRMIRRSSNGKLHEPHRLRAPSRTRWRRRLRVAALLRRSSTSCTICPPFVEDAEACTASSHGADAFFIRLVAYSDAGGARPQEGDGEGLCRPGRDRARRRDRRPPSALLCPRRRSSTTLHYSVIAGRKPGALDRAAPLRGWKLDPAFDTLRCLLEARFGPRGKREYIQVLRLLEDFPERQVAVAVQDAVKRRAIGFDAVKHLLLARIECPSSDDLRQSGA